MKNNPKSAQEAELKTTKWKTILKVHEKLKQQSNERQFALRCRRSWRNNPMKNNPKSAQEAELSNNQMKDNSKSVREAEVTIKWNTIVKVQEMLK